MILLWIFILFATIDKFTEISDLIALNDTTVKFDVKNTSKITYSRFYKFQNVISSMRKLYENP